MKRILSVLIMAAIVLGAMPMAFADSDLQERIEYISSLEIMTGYEDGSFLEDNPITRAEFTAVAIRLAGQSENAESLLYDGRFSDVSPDFWASGYIAIALNMGIVNGYTEGDFRPDNSVTYNEAVKMLVSLLGYTVPASMKGGYPDGYMTVAHELNLIDFPISDAKSAITRGDVARLVYNALKAELMIVDSIKGNGNYTLGTGGTVLETFFKSEKKEGIVTANEFDSIHNDAVSGGRVEIDNVVYMTDIDCGSFLGECVEYVLKSDNTEEKVVYIAKKPTSQRVTVSSEDIIDVEGIFTSDGQIRYWSESKKMKSISFVSSLNVVYNNKILSYSDAGSIDFEKDPDSYECVDTDNDGKYDLLKLKDYEDCYVRRVYEDNEIPVAVTDGGAIIRYDKDDGEHKFITLFENTKTDFNEIKAGDIISVAKSLDKKAYEIIISRKTVEGTVSAAQEEDGKVTITIEGVDYRVSDTVVKEVPKLNDSGIFYLDFDGEIAYFEGTQSSKGTYGFLTDVFEEENGLSTYVKILETNNTFSVYPLAEKVKISDKGSESTKTPEGVADILDRKPTWDDIRDAHTQVIRYKLSSDGEVNYIATARETPDEKEFSIAAPNRKRFFSNSLFDQQWKVTSDTVVFYIPSTKQGEEYTRYRAGNASKYFKSGNTYQVILYDADENGELGAIFYSLTGQERVETFSIDYASSKIMTVDKVAYKIDTDNNERCVVSGIVNNSYTSVYVNKEFMESSSDILKFGNIIQYQTNSTQVQAAYYEEEPEEIVKAVLWCNFTDTPMRKLWNKTEIEQNSPKITTVYGTVMSVDNTKVRISVPNSSISDYTDVFINENQSVVKINNKTLDMGTFYDIQPGKEIFVRMRYDKIKDVVILNK